jgi:hypothetical protein
VVLARLVAELLDVVAADLGLEEGVIDHRGQIGGDLAAAGRGRHARGARLLDGADRPWPSDDAHAALHAVGTGLDLARDVAQGRAAGAQARSDAVGDDLDEPVDVIFVLVAWLVHGLVLAGFAT